MIKNMSNRILVILLPVLFIGTSIIPSISGDYKNEQDTLSVTFYTFDKTGIKECKVEISTDAANIISDTFEEVKYKLTNDPISVETKTLKNNFVELLDIYNLIPQETTKENVYSLLNPKWLWLEENNPFAKHSISHSGASTVIFDVLPMQSTNTGTAVICSMTGGGKGLIFTPIMFPRPRFLTIWSSFSSAVSTAANLYTGRGFVASGSQTGVALGFWGVGLSFAFPGEPAVFGFGGYALLTLVRADEIETYPLNQVPVISDENPSDGIWDIPVSLSELSFRIIDPDGDRMSYTVTTDPDIGGCQGSGYDGVYTIPVSGLKISTQYKWLIEVSDGKDTSIQELSFMTETLPFDPYEEGWQYRKKIIIDHARVAADHTDFPVLLSTIDNDLHEKAQNEGIDILFMDGAGVANKLFHEIEKYDDSSGELVAWVRIPSLSSSVDTEIYMYYGNPFCGSQQFPQGVWDSNYCGVWHLKDFLDSTFNNNDGINYGTDDCSGKIGCAKKFVGTKYDYIKIIDSPSLDITEEITLSSWVKFDTISVRYPPFIIYKRGKNNNWEDPYKLGIADYENGAEFRINGELINGGEVNTGQWYNIVGTFNGEIKQLFINGVKIIQETDESTIQTSSRHLYIGVDQDSGGMNQFVDGVIDEVKILKKSRSSEWISTEYINQNDPLSFLSIGPEEPAL